MEGLQSTKSDWLHKAEGNELEEIILRHCQTENKTSKPFGFIRAVATGRELQI